MTEFGFSGLPGAERDKPSDALRGFSEFFQIGDERESLGHSAAVDQQEGIAGFEDHVPEWELDALERTMASLTDVEAMLGDQRPTNKAHFDYQLESIRYNTERLRINLHPAGIAGIREALRKSIVDCWFGLMMKHSPRFFSDANGEPVLDTESRNWTPDFYKVAEGWPVLSSLLKDKEILDPFGGAGTLVNLLVARNIPSAALLSDIAYRGGRPLNEEGHTYLPALNNQISQLLFDDLPSWYKPDFSPIKGYITASADALPIKDNSVDYIVTDPPFGKDCPSGGMDLLLRSLPEFQRVAREGSILMLPESWVDDISATGYEITQLTKDVSHGHSKLPICYILVSQGEKHNEV